jgi:2,3-bisphosphoglycerate-independent phosphoglycerate mutase
MNKPRCLLMILDGWGISEHCAANAVALAATPVLDAVAADYPGTRLACSGQAVGLPEGIMGNSEVGHLNIGAGRVVFQDLVRIDHAIRDQRFFKNQVITDEMNRCVLRGAALHLMGLVSDGGVHSQLRHLLALLDMAKTQGLKRVFVHAILDGRDTPPDSGLGYIRQLQAHMDAQNLGVIATVCGRYFAMDRDGHWDRTQRAYRLYADGVGIAQTDALAAVTASYGRGETDEFVEPVVITDSAGGPVATVADGDGIVFFNFRADRARQITRAFMASEFDGFDRHPKVCPGGFVCMTRYDETFALPVAFAPVALKQLLGQVVSAAGLRQLRIAETEKYAHVTYFFNGGQEQPFPGEDRCLIASPREVATYDEKPQMSAAHVTRELLKRLRETDYDLVVLNFANMDMVGHTGRLDAAIRACEAVDACVGAILKERPPNMTVLITADHGNAETMADSSGKPHTAHTLNPVPFLLVDDTRRHLRLAPGVLADIAPTVLDILGLEVPPEMTGRSLLNGNNR